MAQYIDPNLIQALVQAEGLSPADPRQILEQQLRAQMQMGQANNLASQPKTRMGHGALSAAAHSLRGSQAAKLQEQALQQLLQAGESQRGMDAYGARYNELKEILSAQAAKDAERQEELREEQRKAKLAEAVYGDQGKAAAVAAGITLPEEPEQTPFTRDMINANIMPGTDEYRDAAVAKYRPRSNVTTQLPPGAQPVFDDQGKIIDVTYPKGTDPWYKRQEYEAKQSGVLDLAETKLSHEMLDSDSSLGIIDQAIETLDKDGGAGWMALLDWVPESAPKQLRADVEALSSVVALETMRGLKAMSKQGATGFGQLSEKELKILVDSKGSLERTQRPERLRETLLNIRKHYGNFRALLEGGVPEGYLRVQDPDTGIVYIQSPYDNEWVQIK